jgi:hypothetical protein
MQLRQGNPELAAIAEQNPEQLVSMLQQELNKPQSTVDKYNLDPVQEVSLHSVTPFYY